MRLIASAISSRIRLPAGVSRAEARIVEDVTLPIEGMPRPAFGKLVSLPASGDAALSEDEGLTPPVQREDGSWLVDGMTPVDEFEQLVGVRGLDDEEGYSTVAGLVMHLLRAVPTEGDKAERPPLTFEVVDMDGRRVDKVRARLGNPEAVEVIHGGVSREERRKVVERFMQDKDMLVLIANDAAGEGVIKSPSGRVWPVIGGSVARIATASGVNQALFAISQSLIWRAA